MGKNKEGKKHHNKANRDEVLAFIKSKGWDIGDIQDIISVENSKKVIECSHTNKNGDIKVVPVDGPVDGLFRCEKCGKTINLAPISIKDAKEAVRIVDTMCDQIKIFSSNKTDDRRTISEMGKANYNVGKMLKVYESIAPGKGMKKNKKKNKNKNKNRYNDHMIGDYGVDKLLGGR